MIIPSANLQNFMVNWVVEHRFGFKENDLINQQHWIWNGLRETCGLANLKVSFDQPLCNGPRKDFASRIPEPGDAGLLHSIQPRGLCTSLHALRNSFVAFFY